MSDEIPELTRQDFARAIDSRVRRRIIAGRIERGGDVAALRRFVGLTQAKFGRALGVSLATVRAWERGTDMPQGPALALLRVAARHPRVLRANLVAAS